MDERGSSDAVDDKHGRPAPSIASISRSGGDRTTSRRGRCLRWRELCATIAAAACLAALPMPAASAPRDASAVVRGFLVDVRSGRDPDAVHRYFAAQVAAHQLISEKDATVVRTPDDYAAHVREFLALFGAFDFTIEELIGEGDRVYARWRQTGRHRGSFEGERPTGAPLVEIGSAVYRVHDGRIVEYWIQTDRKGLEAQLLRASADPRR